MSASHGPLNLSAEALDSAKHVSMSLKISVHLNILLKREISGQFILQFCSTGIKKKLFLYEVAPSGILNIKMYVDI